MDRLLSVKEVAEYLNVKPVTVRRRANSGEIPSIRIGNRIRFHKQEIDRWLLSRSNGRLVNILVIDDEPLVGELFKESLNENIYQVTTTLSSLEALELMGEKHFDLIFLDLLIPELDGAELFRRIRQMDKDVLVAIITGYPDSELMGRAMEYGPFTVLKKPFDNEQIQDVIHSLSKSIPAKE